MATPVRCGASRHLPAVSAPHSHVIYGSFKPFGTQKGRTTRPKWPRRRRQAWIQDLQCSDVSPEALKALRRSQELADLDGTACCAAHVAYVLVAEVLGATGAPTPWGADVAGAAGALRRRAAAGEGEALPRLLEAAERQRAPAKVGLRDLCAAIFELSRGRGKGKTMRKRLVCFALRPWRAAAELRVDGRGAPKCAAGARSAWGWRKRGGSRGFLTVSDLIWSKKMLDLRGVDMPEAARTTCSRGL